MRVGREKGRCAADGRFPVRLSHAGTGHTTSGNLFRLHICGAARCCKVGHGQVQAAKRSTLTKDPEPQKKVRRV